VHGLTPLPAAAFADSGHGVLLTASKATGFLRGGRLAAQPAAGKAALKSFASQAIGCFANP